MVENILTGFLNSILITTTRRARFFVLTQLIGLLILLQLGADVNESIQNMTTISGSNALKTNSSTLTDTNLIRICDSFRDIISEEAAHSCDYSMLYYKGQCEFYSSFMNNETETMIHDGQDFSFCADPRIDDYIEEHNLAEAPRSPTLIPIE